MTLVVLAIAIQLLHQRDQLLKGQIGIVLEERNRIASECHDTLMAGFAAISWQLEATARLFRGVGEPASPAAQSCDLARSMVAHCQAEACPSNPSGTLPTFNTGTNSFPTNSTFGILSSSQNNGRVLQLAGKINF